ncbi:hypothetical protein [Pseudomonas alvandae]|uniref:hypothetical protein n=1 Tax=Pseudomonas canavaninivorans TaxID=2842348 RepID=UPI002FEE7245
MDCIIKIGFSLALKGIIQKLVDNAQSYNILVRSDEWRVAVNLEAKINNKRVCEDLCPGCLEFERTAKMFVDFTQSISRTNDKNENLINKLRSTFLLSEEKDPVSLAMDLIAAPIYVKSKIEKDNIEKIEDYAREIQGAIYALALDHYLHEQAKCSGRLLSHGELEQKQVISYERITILEGQKIFYADQNFISKYGSDSNLKIQVDNFKSRVGCNFIFSPYVIEDGIKMNRVRLKEYLESVESLTDCIMLVRSGETLTLAKEDIHKTFNRVILWRDATRAAEDQKIFKMLYNHWGYSHFSRGSKFSKRANDNIIELFESLRPHLIDMDHEIEFDDFESDPALCVRLNAYTIEKSFTLHDLVSLQITPENDLHRIELIDELCDFLDFINYKTEALSEQDKIRSSLQDAEHLKHAWLADYFITDDKRLRARGELIYSVIGVKTKFINRGELKGLMINALQNQQ